MPSVEFSDSYRIQSFGYTTNYVRIDYTEVEYDIASNKTKVRLDGVYIKYTGGTASSRCFGTLEFNGTTMLSMDGSPYQLNVSESYTLVPGTDNGATVWIQHNDVGAATLTIALSGGTRNDDNDDVFGALYYYGSGYPVIGVRTPASKNVALATHPRASTIASSSTSVSTLGTYFLTMNRKASSNYHVVTFLYNNSTVLYSSGHFGTSYDLDIPRSFFRNYPSLSSLPVTVSVQTYNSSGTAIGSPATTSLTIYADADMKPVVSSGWVSLAPYNTGAVSGFTGYVKGYSRAQATFNSSKISMTNAVGASIASYFVTCQGTTDSSSPYQTPVLTSTSVSVTCTVKDSRGRTASQAFTLSVYDYSKPSLYGISVFRCTETGTASEDGTCYSAKATRTFSSLNGQNTCTLKVSHAQSGGSYGTEYTLTSGTARVIGSLSVDKSYTVRIIATDSLGNSATYTAKIPTKKWAMKFRPNGQGVAFGKAAEYDKTFEIADDWYLRYNNYIPLNNVVNNIPSGADLNDYGLPGVYAIGDNSTAATIANIPQQNAGTLRVFSSNGGNISASSTWKYLIQEYITFTGERYQRYGNSGSGTAVTWGAWKTIYTSAEYTNDSAAITTSHTIMSARAARIGRIYIANITVQVTSNLSAWTTIFTMNNVTIPESQYVRGDVNGGTAATFYIGRTGNVSCINALQNNDTIKIAIPLVLN